MTQVGRLVRVDQVAQHTLDEHPLVASFILRLVQLYARSRVLMQLDSHLLLLVLEDAVPVIFDTVVCSAQDRTCQLGPPVLRVPLHNEQNPVLFCAPVELVEQRAQLIAPTLSALLARSI